MMCKLFDTFQKRWSPILTSRLWESRTPHLNRESNWLNYSRCHGWVIYAHMYIILYRYSYITRVSCCFAKGVGCLSRSYGFIFASKIHILGTPTPPGPPNTQQALALHNGGGTIGCCPPAICIHLDVLSWAQQNLFLKIDQIWGFIDTKFWTNSHVCHGCSPSIAKMCVCGGFKTC